MAKELYKSLTFTNKCQIYSFHYSATLSLILVFNV